MYDNHGNAIFERQVFQKIWNIRSFNEQTVPFLLAYFSVFLLVLITFRSILAVF